MADDRKRSSGWSGVDQTTDPEFYRRYLDNISTSDWARAYKQQTYALLEARTGHHILDVGCGTGEDVRALAQIVGGTGRVIGVDKSETLINEERNRTEGVSSVKFRVADGSSLDRSRVVLK